MITKTKSGKWYKKLGVLFIGFILLSYFAIPFIYKKWGAMATLDYCIINPVTPP